MPKARLQRKIDVAPVVKGGGAPASSAVAVDIAPPAPPSIDAPDNLSLSTSIGSSTAAPTAIISATWDAPPGLQVQRYVVQASTSSGFPAAATITLTTFVRSVAFEALRPGVLYYVRVAAVVQGWQGTWSDTASITSALDTVAAGVPTSISASFIGTGDLLITWANPTEANFKIVQGRVRASAGGTIYRTFESAAGRFLYTAAMNLADTGGVGDPSLYVELWSRTFSNVDSATVNTGLVTKTAPSAPSLSQSWNGDTGTAGPDLKLSWTAAADVAYWLLTLNGGTAIRLYASAYTYTLAHNISDNTSADPTITYSLVAVDGLGQSSSAASGTATNAAPAAPSSVTISGFFSSFAISISATPPADFSHYLVRIIQTSPSAADVTFKSTATLITRTASVAATYQVGVKIVDLFGQASSETLSSTATLDALTLSDLRSRIVYSDSESTAAATLKAALADDVKTSGGISYSSNASWVRWIRADWLLLEHIRTITLSMTPSSGTTNWYVRVSKDSSTWTYFAGPVVATGTSGQNTTLTAVADATAAQASPVSAATLGGSTTSRIDLPSLQEARYIEVWLRNTAASTRVDEFYPRRLVQSDDGEFESIKAINIAAATITGDRLTANAIDAFTITGATIRSAASGARWEGNSTHLFGTDGSTTQWEVLNSTGKLTAGGGNIILDATGITVNASSGTLDALKFHNASDSGNIGNIWALRSSSGASFDSFYIERRRRDATNLGQIIMADKLISLYPDGANGGMDISSTAASIYSDTTIQGGLNIGSASGATTGQILATKSDAGTTNVTNLLTLTHNSSGSPAAGFGVDFAVNLKDSSTADQNTFLLRTVWATATHGSQKGQARCFVYDTAARRVMDWEASGTAAMISFLGAAAVTRPNVTGTRTGTLAQLQTVVANLLTALGAGSLGLITDSTT